jgi:presequence protease
VRDPFFKMLPRTLSNFMNAFTSADHTTYPFATTNRQDYKNLMSVYLDATLHPLLKESDFTQEGWRVGPENPLESSDPANEQQKSPLIFKGVVYNEMKGQMSDAGYLYYVRWQDHLFPDINNSGGDPQKMTDLTYEQLKNFHADHYHPSNAKLFTYGDMSISDLLKDVNEHLDQFTRIKVDQDIKNPISLNNGPIYVTVPGPIDPLVPSNMQYKTSTTWLMGDNSDVLEKFSLGVLGSLLLEGYGSPLYRALVESGLGVDFSPNTGFDSAGRHGVFSVGLTGVKKDDVSKVKDAIFSTLSEVKDKGFDKIKVDGILHQLELALKHKTSHFGMGLLQTLKPDWFNGIDPLQKLAWQETVTAFNQKYSQGNYLEGLLEKYLLSDNTLTFSMEPSEDFAQILNQEETDRLAKKISETTKDFPSAEEAHKHLERREIELLELQESARNEDLSVLPSVHVQDIPRQGEHYDFRFSVLDNVKIQWREAPTNGLTYFRAINVMKDLPDELRELMPLFCDSIMRLGTADLSMEQLEELIKLKTGGINVAYHSATSPNDINISEEGLAFSGYALDSNIPAMYDLLRRIVVETDFDRPDTEKKIRELLQGSANGAVGNIAQSGHSYAKRFAEAGLTPTGRLLEQTAGLSQVKLIATLAARPESDSLGDVIRKLKAIQTFAIAATNSLRVALTCGKESSDANEAALRKFLSGLSCQTADLASNRTKILFPRNSKTFFPLPYQVYYSALSIPTVPYTHADGAPLQILAQLLTHKHLHHEIREKGGAYGGGAYSSGLGGVFGITSYRDPNPINTIKIANESGVWARDRLWTSLDIEEAKLSVFQSLDAPKSVNEEGMAHFLLGVDQNMQQKRREQLLDVKAEDVKNVANKYLVQGIPHGNLVVLGEKKGYFAGSNGWEIRDLGMIESTHKPDDLDIET